jgi:hypothetical protein
MPEVHMYISSSCADKSRVWDSSNAGVLSHFFPGKRALQDEEVTLKHVILVGTHHKTGTYLAKKMFSRLCARMSLCCIFHMSHDPESHVRETLDVASPNIIGHWHWAWFPEDIVPRRNYRFVHFYRSPFKKISSGFRYHKDGVEGWSRYMRKYMDTCSTDEDKICKGAHLCEPCCHNVFRLAKIHRPLAEALPGGLAFVCKHLGNVSTGLSEALTRLPVEEGVLVQAGVDFFETLNMALIVNHTWNDPNTLNIDLDDYMANFEKSTKKLLNFLQLPYTHDLKESLVEDLSFFDVRKSFWYKAFMESGYNHVNTHVSDKDPSTVVCNAELVEAYAFVNELMKEAMTKSKQR